MILHVQLALSNAVPLNMLYEGAEGGEGGKREEGGEEGEVKNNICWLLRPISQNICMYVVIVS